VFGGPDFLDFLVLLVYLVLLEFLQGREDDEKADIHIAVVDAGPGRAGPDEL
jgi:hypothetical protein